MYHHRYQPQTSLPANDTSNAFVRDNHFRNSPSAAARDYHSKSARAPAGSFVDPSTASSSASSPVTYQNTSIFVGHNRAGAKNQAYHSGAYFLQPKQFAEERQDVIFRRVRGILNKITPETFDKLSKELVNVGLDSPRTLRGLIYLLFDKALKDLKYSSLYAKLCQELSERSPNFEKEPGPNTFCKFLISKCEDEFERRRKATEDFDNKHELTDEEFEQKAIAKQKMLGNIKFICELGKKRLLQEEILHECIRGLLSKKKERPLQDQAQDLECLCQIMRTIGSLLDIEASRNLMNQYFERIDMFSRKPDLPSRIRFMLKDVIDLRNNNWRPRPFQREDTVPQPLSKLREESGFGHAASNPPIDKLGNTKNLRNINDLSKLHGNNLASILMDDDGPSFTTTADFHWGSTFLPDETDFDPFSREIASSYVSNPSQRPIPIKVTATSAPSTVSRTQPPNQPHPTPYLGQRFSQIDRSDQPVENQQNQTDFLSKSSRSNIVQSVRNTRELPNSDDILVIRRHDPILNRSEASLAHDRKYFSREEPRNSHYRPPPTGPHSGLDTHNHKATVYQDKGDFSERHDQGNNEFPRSPMSAVQRGPVTLDEIRPTQDTRRVHSDMTKQQTHDRHSGHSLGARNNINIRRPDDISPPPHLMPVSERYNSQSHDQSQEETEISQPTTQVRNPEMNNSNLGPRRFERRGERREFDHPPSRQPKFSGANYRLPGRDRALPPLRNPQIVDRANQPPESEANLNWRSAEPIRPANPTKDSMAQAPRPKPPPSKPLIDMFDPTSRFANKSKDSPVDISTGKLEKHASELRIDEPEPMRPSFVQFSSVSVQQQARQGAVLEPVVVRRTPSPSRNDRYRSGQQSFNPSESVRVRRTEETLGPPHRQNLDSQSISKDRSINYDRNHANRIDHRENGDHSSRRVNLERNDFQHTSPPVKSINAERSDHKQQQIRDTGEKFGGRSYRPAVGRNQSFDLTNSDLRRGPNVRKDTIGPNNNQVNRRENQPPIPSILAAPILPKAPTRISATDFTLRPSHNLIGRAQPDWTTQSKSVEVAEQNIDVSDERQATIVSSEKSLPLEQSKIKSEDVEINSEGALKNVAKLQNVDKFVLIFTESLGKGDTSKLASKIKELKTPKEDHDECIVAVLKYSIVRSEKDRIDTSKLLNQLVPSIIEPSALLNAFRTIFDQLHVLEIETPKVKSLVAEFLSRAVVDSLLSINDVAQVLNGGKHHPLFLLFLQKLEKSAGQAWLSENFISSKVNLMDMLPEVDRTKDRLVSALKDRCLGFLDPMLTIEPDLWSQMTVRDPSPAAVYRWIKDNVDQSIQSTPTFAHVFIACLLRYIHETVKERLKANNNNSINQPKDSDSSDSNKSSPTNSSSHGINDYEKELLSRYQQVMHALLQDKQMQLATLYALQAFYHGLDFPKGALLRWFHMMYDLSIVDDDVFFMWKEEINDKVPGKGQALFQVNTWLNWLAEAEDEEEEDA